MRKAFVIAASIAAASAECGDPMVLSMKLYSDEKCQTEWQFPRDPNDDRPIT